MAGKCFSCQGEIDLPRGAVSRAEVCPACGSDVRVCYNCMFYEVGAYNSCREPQAERVVEKDRANFCDYFSFVGGGKYQGITSGAAGGNSKAALKQQFEGLFKK